MIPPFIVPTDPRARLSVVETDRPNTLVKTALPLNDYPKCPPYLEHIYQEFPTKSSIRGSPLQNATNPDTIDIRTKDGPTTRTNPLPGYHCPCCPASKSCCERSGQRDNNQSGSNFEMRRGSQSTTPLLYFVNQGNPVYKIGGAVERIDTSKLPGIGVRAPTFTSPSFTVQADSACERTNRGIVVRTVPEVIKERSAQPVSRLANPLVTPLQETTYYLDPRSHGTIGKSTTSFAEGNVNTVYSQRLDLPEDVVAISPDYVLPEHYSVAPDIMESPEYTTRGGVRLGHKSRSICC